MKYFIFLLLFTSLNAFGETYRVVSLFEADAMVTGRFLPFKVYNSQNQLVHLKNVTSLNQCQAMIDPYSFSIFHLYCLNEVTAGAKITLSTNEVVFLDNIIVKRVSIIDAKEPPTEPIGVSLGRQLFVNNCVRCHNSQAIAKPKTAAQIRAAFQKEPMKAAGLDTLLSGDDEKINALVKFINEEL